MSESRSRSHAVRCEVLASTLLAGISLALAAGAADYKPGDLNDDGCVDLQDFSLLSGAFGGTPPGPCGAAYDLDHNGSITANDLSIFNTQYFLAPVACREPVSPFGCTQYDSCEVVCEDVCNLPDNGSGTVDLPPAGCSYLSPGNFHAIVNSLPPGTQLEVNVTHRGFTNITRTPGGALGGEIEQFDSEVRLEIHGRGTLVSYDRVVVLPGVPVEIHTAPKQPGEPYQTFDSDLRSIVAEISPGDLDSDFQLLRITAGTDNGMPSPGSTTLVETNSFDTFGKFDVAYQIEMIGRAGGPLAGLSSTTTGTVTMGTPGTAPEAAPLPALSTRGLVVTGLLALGFGLAGLHLRYRQRRT